MQVHRRELMKINYFGKQGGESPSKSQTDFNITKNISQPSTNNNSYRNLLNIPNSNKESPVQSVVNYNADLENITNLSI